jgi:aspartate aminotransferase-like enzyme
MSENGSAFGTFFVPGPTEVRQEVLDALRRPMIPHRSAAFEELFARIQSRLKKVFRTERPVFVIPASGTGMMEAAIRCAPAGRILSLVNGAFAERFARIAEACGREVDRFAIPWGEVHAPSELAKYLTNGTYAAITVAHSETSTGALNDIRRLSDAAHEAGVRCLIDSVSGMAGAVVEFDQWKLDYVLTGSQKALAIPPGLAFSVASESFIESAKEVKGRGIYFDLVELDEFALQGQVPSTPAVSLCYALDVQLDAIVAEGMEARWRRHADMLSLASSWVDECRENDIDIENIVEPGSRSPTVSTIRLPQGMTSATFTRKVAAQGITVATGYGKLKEATFRIGHMGDHTTATLGRCLNACAAALGKEATVSSASNV